MLKISLLIKSSKDIVIWGKKTLGSKNGYISNYQIKKQVIYIIRGSDKENKKDNKYIYILMTVGNGDLATRLIKN